MSQREFNHLSNQPQCSVAEQLATLRRELTVNSPRRPKQPAGGSWLDWAMREDADFLDEIVEGAMKARREQPWRLSPGE